MLIAIEAIDAAGKATQAKLLAEWLNKGEYGPDTARLQAFPDYDSRTGQMILSLLKEDWWPTFSTWPGQAHYDAHRALLLQTLMTQNRYEKLDMLKRYAGAPFSHMVCDRYFASGLVYGQADGLELDYLRDVHAGLPPADLWILLDITAEESVLRRPHRRDEYEKRAGFMEAVRKRYLDLFANPGVGGKWVVVDGMQSTENVRRQIIDVIHENLGAMF